MIPITRQAVSASLACAADVGLPAGDPEVIAEGYSIRVWLRPTPVVTRVVTLGRTLRPDPRPWLEREVAVATFLRGAGAPVVGPWRDPGPHDADGLEVTLWHRVEHEPEQVAPAVFGAMLGDLHQTLASYPGDLPLLVGPLTDISTALQHRDDPVLHQSAEELMPLALTWPRRPLHGDAHIGNVLVTLEGPVWNDFEDVCSGPLEWDLASLTITDEAIAAYPHPVDAERLEDCRALRRLQILASLLMRDESHPDLYNSLVARLTARPQEGAI